MTSANSGIERNGGNRSDRHPKHVIATETKAQRVRYGEDKTANENDM